MQSLPGSENISEQRTWWNSLSSDWKRAFTEICSNNSLSDSELSDESLNFLWTTPVVRIVGPGGNHANFTGALHDLEGLRALKSLEYIFVMHCGLDSLNGIERHLHVKSLYVQYNRLSSFEQIRNMASLKELHINNNQITSLAPLKYCKMLETVCCELNAITSLDGIKPYHEKHLKLFKCRPNDQLPQREIVRVQNTYGILCH